MTHPSFPATHFYYTLVPIHTIHGEALTPDPPARPQGMRWHHTGKAYACGNFMVFQWTGQREHEVKAYEEFRTKQDEEFWKKYRQG